MISEIIIVCNLLRERHIISNIADTKHRLYNVSLHHQHYLSYLNCLRVKEFSGAVHSLLRTYDGQLTPREPGRVEDQGRGFRYAAMNLAALHAHFGHK